MSKILFNLVCWLFENYNIQKKKKKSKVMSDPNSFFAFTAINLIMSL